MKKTIAFFQLIRYPNLIFIVLTQFLFYFCIVRPAYIKAALPGPVLVISDFWLLVFASVCIAAAGYIINDYFDLNIDKINKPNKMVIGKHISRRWAMLFHLLLSLLGLVLTGIVTKQIGNWFILVFNTLSVVLLLFYSTSFKKRFLIGNIIISILTAWVILVLFAAELRWDSIHLVSVENAAIVLIYTYAVVYAGFAFIVSLIREVVKDMEDETGDRKYQCKTMPIVWGINPTKIFVGVWIVVLMGVLTIMLFYALLQQWFLLVLFILVLLLFALYTSLKKLIRATTTEDYAKISSNIKLIMLSGVLSMLLYFYHAA